MAEKPKPADPAPAPPAPAPAPQQKEIPAGANEPNTPPPSVVGTTHDPERDKKPKEK